MIRTVKIDGTIEHPERLGINSKIDYYEYIGEATCKLLDESFNHFFGAENKKRLVVDTIEGDITFYGGDDVVFIMNAADIHEACPSIYEDICYQVIN
jgi:hypothetical protein